MKYFQIKLLKNTKIFFYKQNIFISGPRGVIVYKNLITYKNAIFKLSKTELHCYQKDKMLTSNNFLMLYALLNESVYNVHFFFSKKLLLVGVGMRVWIKSFENRKVILLKLGFSQDLYIPVPDNLIVFPLRSTLLLVRGLNKEKVTLFTSYIKRFRSPDLYKGKGLQYKNEVIRLKPGKKS
jgi:large subunit ribosomal protein L6